MKRFFTFTLSLLLPALLLAQSKVTLNPGGSLAGPANEVLKIRTAINADRGFSKITPYDRTLAGVTGTIDTLQNAPDDFNWGSNFGEFGQDVFVQWFEAPADLTINAVSFNTTDDEQSDVSVKLIMMAWDKDQIQETTSGLGATWWGYYEATGNGFNDIGALPDDGDITGGWVEASETSQAKAYGSPFAEDIWSDIGEGAPATAVTGTETWVNMDLLGFSPEVLAGDIFGVVVKNSSTNLDADRFGVEADNSLGITGFKHYKNGRLVPGGIGVGDLGWWSRLFSWNFRVAVELTGDRAPVIAGMDQLATTLSTAARTVTATISDDNPSGGDAGVQTAMLYYTVDGGDPTAVAMTGTEPDYSADIPGQAPGSAVSYWIEATDVGGLSVANNPWTYNIFEQVNRTLLVMNGQGASGYPTTYYFGDNANGAFYAYDRDVWAFGPLTAELVDYYYDIVEIATNGPNAINNDVIRAWLEADGSRDYMLAGDEWIGSQTGWVNGPREAGSFHYDILGITFEYNDLVASSADRNQVLTVAGSALGDAMHQLVSTVVADSPQVGVDTVWYDPNFEIGVTNWLDGVDVTEDSEVFLQGISTGDGATYNIGHNRTLAAGNKIAFFGYDPLSINSTPYYWFGFDATAPQVKALEWMDAVNDIEDRGEFVAREFSLKQNYPNPFNPTTTISYVLPSAEKVQVKVFDLMGREVATLVNEKQNAGSQAVAFDASNFASGMYVYTIKAGSFNDSKKMLLVK